MRKIKDPYAAKAFWLALGLAVLLFLPFVVYDRGYFLYFGDFNVQQIPFYKLAHEAVRNGDIFWNWYTDLGANFIGSYSFYLLFSPFFWLTLPFPTAFLPYLMAPLLALKMACASWTAYLYLRRFVRDLRWAVVGGFLYAFSGWMLFDIFFNHFLEVAAFFPLLLLGVEKLVTEDKKAFFALTVALNAMVNYWFFIGEAVFVAFYILIRMTDRRWGMTLRKFRLLAFEAVLGTLLAAVVLLPSAMALMGNPRTGFDNLLTGWNFWLYWHEQRQPAILQSLFFPPELPARSNFFPDHNAKWASLSGWLPVVGITGVLTYFFTRKNDWVKKLLALCLVVALVPGLNSLFVLLNHSYYARWFYMPVLIMALASIRALETLPADAAPYGRALKWTTGIVCVFVVMSGLTPVYSNNQWTFGMAAYPAMLWAYAGFAAMALLLCWTVVMGLRRNKRYVRFVGGAVALFTLAFGISYMACGKSNSDHSDFLIHSAIRGREHIVLPAAPFARTDVYSDMDNIAMFWHLPNIQAFHSIVPPSIMEFYPEMGVTRDVGSRPGPEPYALRSLLSVRWLFIRQDNENQEPMPGFSKYSEQVGFHVYENKNYLPMGFGYTHYISRGDLGAVPEKYRANLLLRVIVLEEDGVDRNWRRMEYFDVQDVLNFSVETFEADVAARRLMAADSFSIDNRGFTSATNLPEDTLLFYSVPYDSGWSATLDGEPVPVEKANVGFMAVWVPAGEHVVRFSYLTPGLIPGLFLTGASGAVFILYLLIARRRTKPSPAAVEDTETPGAQTRFLSWDEYLTRRQSATARRAHLQRTLNEASQLHVRESIGEDEMTMRFVIDTTGETRNNPDPDGNPNRQDTRSTSPEQEE